AIPRTRLSPSASSPRCRPATPPLFQVVPNIRSPVAAITGTRIDPTNDSSFSEAIPSLSLTRVKEFFHAYSRATAAGRAEEATGPQPRRACGQAARRFFTRDFRSVANRCTAQGQGVVRAVSQAGLLDRDRKLVRTAGRRYRVHDPAAAGGGLSWRIASPATIATDKARLMLRAPETIGMVSRASAASWT